MTRILCPCVALFLVILAVPASAKPTTFQKSCQSLSIAPSDVAVFLKASCRTRAGEWRTTRIELPGIVNSYGFLLQNREPHSSFQRSCENIHLQSNPYFVTLKALCGNGRGGSQKTELILDSIENIDGRLQYVAGDWRAAMTAGNVDGPTQARPRDRSAPASRTMKFEGRWRWAGAAPNAPSNNNKSLLEIYQGDRDGEGGYCYNSRCFDVTLSVQGDSYGFTTNGSNWFSFRSPEPGMMNGRYWTNKASRKAPPKATVSMRQTAGPE